LHRLTAGELIHRGFGDIQATGSGVDGQHVDRLALIRDGEALPALSAIPAGDGRGTADVGEVGDRTESLVAVPGVMSVHGVEVDGFVISLLGDEAVSSIRACNCRHAA
jgi:hypothetical protein